MCVRVRVCVRYIVITFTLFYTTRHESQWFLEPLIASGTEYLEALTASESVMSSSSTVHVQVQC